MLIALAAAAAMSASAPEAADRARIIEEIAALDTAYQAAVERNDADAMAKILHKDMILVLGDGRVATGAQLIDDARTRKFVYEHQVEDAGTQTVRLYGDRVAIVTARLYLKGAGAGRSFERRLWFSDTYVRTEDGWKYAFGQASLPLPEETQGAKK